MVGKLSVFDNGCTNNYKQVGNVVLFGIIIVVSGMDDFVRKILVWKVYFVGFSSCIYGIVNEDHYFNWVLDFDLLRYLKRVSIHFSKGLVSSYGNTVGIITMVDI